MASQEWHISMSMAGDAGGDGDGAGPGDPQQCGADSSICVWSRDNIDVGCTWSLPTTRLVGALSFVSSQLG